MVTKRKKANKKQEQIKKLRDPKTQLKLYDLLKGGESLESASKALGYAPYDIKEFCKTSKWLTAVVKEGRERIGHDCGKTMREFVYGRLPPDLKRLWDEVEEVKEFGTDPERERVYVKLDTLGEKMRQQLLLHAILSSNWNLPEALRAIGIPYSMFDKWQRTPDFRRLMEEIHMRKKDFVEAALMKLVSQGDVSAVIFANKTLNRDRGYSERVEVSHTHTHTMMAVDQLNLDLDTRKRLLEAYRKSQSVPGLKEHVEDAELVDPEGAP